MGHIRSCLPADHRTIVGIINSAAEAYRGVIPGDCWHEPYLSLSQLENEIAAGVTFWGYEMAGALTGVMGSQRMRDVDLLRHAYVLPARQRHGVGSSLLAHLRGLTTRPMLVGTWADAKWAIRFYERHGFALVLPALTTSLLNTYWTVSRRQIETSVVLANPPFQVIPSA